MSINSVDIKESRNFNNLLLGSESTIEIINPGDPRIIKSKTTVKKLGFEAEPAVSKSNTKVFDTAEEVNKILVKKELVIHHNNYLQ